MTPESSINNILGQTLTPLRVSSAALLATRLTDTRVFHWDFFFISGFFLEDILIIAACATNGPRIVLHHFSFTPSRLLDKLSTAIITQNSSQAYLKSVHSKGSNNCLSPGSYVKVSPLTISSSSTRVYRRFYPQQLS